MNQTIEKLVEALQTSLSILEDNCDCNECGPCKHAELIRKLLETKNESDI